ncbi:MAG TPA: radical SAM protein [Myxococcota bacterium]|nr:radical SAM protein [Myxococcota bacterium]
MEFQCIPDALGLDPEQWSLVAGFLGFREEPESRVGYLARMPQERVAVLLPQLVGLGIVRRRETAQGPWYGLIPVEELLAKAALAAEDPDVFEMEANLLRRVVEGFGTPGLTVISSSEDRDPARRIPEITKYADTLMPYIDLRLGTRCNLNCTYCLLGHENRTTRTTAEIVSDLMLGRRRNLQKVALTGGEPTLHPEVLKIITVARTLGYRQVILVTNGVTLSIPGVLDRLVEAGITAVGISFDTPDKEIAHELWQSPVFDKVSLAFDAVARHPQLLLGSIAVITKKNASQLPDLANWWADRNDAMENLFVPNIDFVMPEENAWLNREELLPKLTDVMAPVLKALEIAHGRGLPLTFRGFPLCLLPGLERYSYDRYMSIFRLTSSAEGDVFDKTSVDLLRTKGPQCRRCKLRRECNGVSRGYANLYGYGELVPVRGA